MLVRETGEGVGPNPRVGDLGRTQTVQDYSRDPALMRRYTHMYTGKHVAAWSRCAPGSAGAICRIAPW